MQTIVVMGSSIAHPNTYQVPLHLCWPTVLESKLQRLGYLVRVRNWAKDGATTANSGSNQLARMPAMTRLEAPDIALLEGGVNDPSNGINQAGTQANLQAQCQFMKFRASGTVAGQANLPALQQPGTRMVVLADTSTTGGMAAAAGQAPTITGAGGGAVTTWEYRNGAAGEQGWGRIATSVTPADATTKIMLCSTQYLNFSGGDTLATPYAAYVPVRAAQKAAAAAEGGLWCNAYGYFRDLIVSGAWPDQTGGYVAATSWHVASGNQHLNQAGHELYAQAVLRDLLSAGWLSRGRS